MSDLRLISDLWFLTSGAPTACRHPVSGTVSLPSSGCFSPFPHGTGALSVTEEYLGLEGGPPTFRQDGSCPALLEGHVDAYPYGAVTRSGMPFQAFPVPNKTTTGLVRFRSPLLAESRLMSVPPATEMFQFAGFASLAYGFSQGYPRGWVAPFGDPGITDRSHLPRAFRSVPRPSSPLSAKASTRCPSRHSILSSNAGRPGHYTKPTLVETGPRPRPWADPHPRLPPRPAASPPRARPGPPTRWFSIALAPAAGPGKPAPAQPCSLKTLFPGRSRRAGSRRHPGPSASVTFANSLYPINQHRLPPDPAASRRPARPASQTVFCQMPGANRQPRPGRARG